MKFSIILASISLVAAAPGPYDKRAQPVVVAPAPKATIGGSSFSGVESFKAIPFAKPPVGQLRLKPPQPLTTDLGYVDGTAIPRACPQFYFSVDGTSLPSDILGTVLNLPIFQAVQNAGEDCLNLNVQRPAGTKAGDKLPVLFWMFGGGFELGSNQAYDATSLVKESVSTGKPVIIVAINYRVGGFGFLPGKEVLKDGSANLGLLDQRLALQWVADNIAAFGGDPDRVTIWGESAGSISVFDQMALYDGNIQYKGKPLFRAGIMNSGSVAPTDSVDCPKAQAIYDTVVAKAGCASASDTLACLRLVSYDTLLKATNSVPGILSYSALSLSYVPRPDGVVLTQPADLIASSGKYADVPFIVGDQEDEGTIFALFTANLTTKADVTNYLSDVFFQNATPELLAGLVATYQDSWLNGSPFNTGIWNNIYPQFKRMAAILGDVTFTLARRTFLQVHARNKPNVKSWSYLATYNHGTPLLGTCHASDLIQVFFGVLPNNAARSIRSYYFSFVYNLDPNVGSEQYGNWPQWNDNQMLREFGANSNDYIKDNFRQASSDWLIANAENLRV